MKDVLKVEVQVRIVKAEQEQKTIEKAMAADYSKVPDLIKRYAKLEVVEGAGELLKDLDKKYGTKWFGVGAFLINSLAKEYIKYVDRKVAV
jgi:hypothetical protein